MRVHALQDCTDHQQQRRHHNNKRAGKLKLRVLRKRVGHTERRVNGWEKQRVRSLNDHRIKARVFQGVRDLTRRHYNVQTRRGKTAASRSHRQPACCDDAARSICRRHGETTDRTPKRLCWKSRRCTAPAVMLLLLVVGVEIDDSAIHRRARYKCQENRGQRCVAKSTCACPRSRHVRTLN